MKNFFLIFILFQIYSCDYHLSYETCKNKNEKNITLLKTLNQTYFYNDLKWLIYLKYCEYKVYNKKYLFYFKSNPKLDLNELYNVDQYFGECDLLLDHYEKKFSNEISAVRFTRKFDNKYQTESFHKCDTIISLGFSSFILPERKQFHIIFNNGDTVEALTNQDYLMSDSSKPYGSRFNEIHYHNSGFFYPVDIDNICNIKEFDSFYNPTKYTQCGKKEFIESHRYILNEWFVKEAERRKYITPDSNAEWKQRIYRKYYQVTRRGIKWIPDEWVFEWHRFKERAILDWDHLCTHPKELIFSDGYYYCHLCDYFRKEKK